MNTRQPRSPNAGLIVAILSTLVGLGLQIYLFIQHFQLKFGSALGEKSLCSINATFNCDAVAMSPYSELFGMPLALWAAAFGFIQLLFLISALSGLSSETDRIIRVSQLLAGFSLLMSLVMGAISLSSMSVYCLFCIGAYVTSLVTFIALFALGLPAISDLTSDLQASLSESKWIAIMLVLIPGLSFFGNAVMRDRMGADRLIYLKQESLANWKSAPEQTLNPDFGISSGPADAKFVLVEFADFLCPHCKSAAPVLHGFYQSRKDVRLVFKPYPLDGACNSSFERAGDGLRCQLAKYSLCAEKLAKKGWAATEWIFEYQSRHNLATWAEDIKGLSKDLGIEVESIKSCIDSPETQGTIDQIVAEAKAGKIRGTPAVFANGRLLEGGQILEVLKAAYEAR